MEPVRLTSSSQRMHNNKLRVHDCAAGCTAEHQRHAVFDRVSICTAVPRMCNTLLQYYHNCTCSALISATHSLTLVLILKPPVSYTIPFPTHTVGPTAAVAPAGLSLVVAVFVAVLLGVYVSMTIAG
jgi:hypothetical protein